MAFTIAKPEDVQREDGTKVKVDKTTSSSEQIKILFRALTSRKIAFLLPIFFSSWLWSSYLTTFLTLHYTVRARALGAFVGALAAVIANIILGFILDSQRMTVKTRARYIGAGVMILYTGALIWAIIIQHMYIVSPPPTLDWSSPGFGRRFGMLIVVGVSGSMVQNYLYWSMGSLGDGTSEMARYAGILRGVESFGECAAFGINSSEFNLLYTVVIIIVFWVVSVPPAWVSLSEIGTNQPSPEVEHPQVQSVDEKSP
ncbi:hypothetical protein H0H92_006761 [Tricholoma furcatifolium]|nr:hypothetical protein H0H92_006761 [Tricholoma furcatifolium]